MIPRYTLPAMAEIWTEEARLKRWLEVEIAVVEAWEKEGSASPGQAATLRARVPSLDLTALVARSEAIELETKHDVIAFLTACEEALGPDARMIHFGLTSSDVVDTALSMAIRDALALIDESMVLLCQALQARARQHLHTLCLGRTHGQAAEPTTFGIKLLGHLSECQRARSRLQQASATIAFGKLSGAVGNFGNVPHRIEDDALALLGLSPEPLATQVLPRDRHAEVFLAMALAGAALERLAVEIRHLQRTEVAEVSEPFGNKQRGSSAMPHKKNPILSENTTGLARLLRAFASGSLENVALWHERDISHSSYERVAFPDATQALHFAIRRMAVVVNGMVVDEARMRHNLDSAGNLLGSGAVLLALVKAGLMRQEAYGLVQKAAMQSRQNAVPFADALMAIGEVAAHLNHAQTVALCDPQNQVGQAAFLWQRVTGEAWQKQ